MQTIKEPTETNKIDVAIQLATEIRKRQGEITVGHIRAMPFLRTPQEVNAVVDQLLRLCDAELEQRKVESEPFLRWEQVIRPIKKC